jgi:hypothetical protein
MAITREHGKGEGSAKAGVTKPGTRARKAEVHRGTRKPTADASNRPASRAGATKASAAGQVTARRRSNASRTAHAGSAQGSASPPWGADAVRRLVATLESQRKEMWDRLVGALAPEARPVPDEGFVLQARRNAELRSRLLDEFRVLTSAQVATVAGSAASNRAALATRWRQEGRIFGVLSPSGGGEYVYPSFQFTAAGQPRPSLRRLIEVFPPSSREWQLFAWLTAPNGWLDRQRPLDRIDGVPETVLRAAAMEFDASRF